MNDESKFVKVEHGMLALVVDGDKTHVSIRRPESRKWPDAALRFAEDGTILIQVKAGTVYKLKTVND